MVRIVACQTTDRQIWNWDIRTQQLQLNTKKEVCLSTGDATSNDSSRFIEELAARNNSGVKFNVSLVRCDSRLPQEQRWLLIPMPWK